MEKRNRIKKRNLLSPYSSSIKYHNEFFILFSIILRIFIFHKSEIWQQWRCHETQWKNYYGYGVEWMRCIIMSINLLYILPVNDFPFLTNLMEQFYLLTYFLLFYFTFKIQGKRITRILKWERKCLSMMYNLRTFIHSVRYLLVDIIEASDFTPNKDSLRVDLPKL